MREIQKQIDHGGWAALQPTKTQGARCPWTANGRTKSVISPTFMGFDRCHRYATLALGRGGLQAAYPMLAAPPHQRFGLLSRARQFTL
jgi:hypothetical protein